jgi:hypothetical protein
VPPLQRRRLGGGGVDGPVGDLPVADLDLDRVDDSTGYTASRGRDCQAARPSNTRSVMVEMVCRETSVP